MLEVGGERPQRSDSLAPGVYEARRAAAVEGVGGGESLFVMIER